jgi:hypothetical protein
MSCGHAAEQARRLELEGRARQDHAGKHASNLNDVQVLTTTQRGFWNPASKAFRGQQFDEELTALALNFRMDSRGRPPKKQGFSEL